MSKVIYWACCFVLVISFSAFMAMRPKSTFLREVQYLCQGMPESRHGTLVWEPNSKDTLYLIKDDESENHLLISVTQCAIFPGRE